MSQNLLSTLTVRQLKRAITIKARIEKLQSDLSGLLGSGSPSTPEEKAPRRRRKKMSPAGRARMSAAAKARWAKIKAAK